MSVTTEKPVVVEVQLSASPEKVWNSLTDYRKMRSWFFDTIKNFVPQVGFETKFDVINGDKVYPHHWKVVEANPWNKLVLDWRYGGYPGDSLVCFEIIPDKQGSRLRLTHSGIESFPSDNPDFSWESCNAGWNYIIGTSFKEFVEKQII